MVWHTEALHRMKRLPPLKRLLMQAEPKRRQTAEEQMEVMQQWQKAMARVEAQKKARV